LPLLLILLRLIGDPCKAQLRTFPENVHIFPRLSSPSMPPRALSKEPDLRPRQFLAQLRPWGGGSFGNSPRWEEFSASLLIVVGVASARASFLPHRVLFSPSESICIDFLTLVVESFDGLTFIRTCCCSLIVNLLPEISMMQDEDTLM
jgi:hypothetical protein